MVECFKWGLIGHPSRNMEDSSDVGSVGYGRGDEY